MNDKSSAELANDIAEKDKEIAQAIATKEVVHQEILSLRKKKIDLDVALSKARYNIDKLKIERSLLNHKFWECKNSGL